MERNMPAIRRHQLDDAAHVFWRHRLAEMRKIEVQADAAHAGRVKPFDLGWLRRRLEQGDAAITAVAGGEQIDQRRMIAAMARRLDEDAALEAEEGVQAEQVLLGRIG